MTEAGLSRADRRVELDFRRFPVIIAFGTAAIAATILWGTGNDLSVLFENAEIGRGQLWRLFTSAFLHTDFLHLLFNLYWLWMLGQPVELYLGRRKTALLLAFLAMVSGAYEFALSQGGVGLSGVVYGLLGLLWVISRRDPRFRRALGPGTVLLFAAWFGFCIVLTVKGIYPVGNFAHGTGFIAGLLVGWALTSARWSRQIAMGIAAFALLGLWGATFGRPNVNLAGAAGRDEAHWGYEALVAHHDQEALGWLLEASKLQPKLRSNWNNLGIAYQRLGDMDKAKAAYERAAELPEQSSSAEGH